jgi:hypothetical protein
MNLRERLELISAIAARLDQVLLPEGFSPHESFMEGEDAEPDERRAQELWSRTTGWKEDLLYLSYYSESARRVSLNTQIRLPLQDGRVLTLDGKSLEHLAGDATPSYDLETAPPSSREQVISTIVAHAAIAIRWFSLYSTPAECISLLGLGERNGVAIGTPAHSDALARLRELTS